MKDIFIFIIKLYRKYISPYKFPSCRFYPTCSEYALEALEKHGVLKGSILSFWRILRCNPYSKGGYDPVPKTFTLFSSKTKPLTQRVEEDLKEKRFRLILKTKP